MGKVFVKGPTESPDDLLAKESQAARAGRVGADLTFELQQNASLGNNPKISELLHSSIFSIQYSI